MQLYSTVTTKYFILELISFLVKIWHVISHLVTPSLVLMTAWILFVIIDYIGLSGHLSSMCTTYINHFSRCLSFIFGIPHMCRFTMLQRVSMGLRSELFGGLKCTTALVPDERANDLLSYGIVP